MSHKQVFYFSLSTCWENVVIRWSWQLKNQLKLWILYTQYALFYYTICFVLHTSTWAYMTWNLTVTNTTQDIKRGFSKNDLPYRHNKKLRKIRKIRLDLKLQLQPPWVCKSNTFLLYSRYRYDYTVSLNHSWANLR